MKCDCCGKTKKPQPRLIPTKRTALDGIVWWVVFDTQTRRYSTRPCFGRYRRKKDCQWAIDYYTSAKYIEDRARIALKNPALDQGQRLFFKKLLGEA